jgi:hypothetical protein
MNQRYFLFGLCCAFALLGMAPSGQAQDPFPMTAVAPAKSVDALHQEFYFMALPNAKMPADQADLDKMVQTHDYLGLGKRLRSATEADEIERDVNWEDAQIYNGAGFLLAIAYMYDAWRLGVSRQDDIGEIRKQRAALAFLYGLDLASIDAPECADATAPGHRIDQLIFQNVSILRYIKAQSAVVRMSSASRSLELEKATSLLRRPDDVLCSGGMAQIGAGLRANGDKPLPEVKGAPGTIGKTLAVPDDPAFRVQFLDPAVYEPKREAARAAMPASLTKFLQGPVAGTYVPAGQDPNICPAPYPSVSQRLQEQGQTLTGVSIGPDHHMTSCSIVRSSGSIRLDEASCRQMRCSAEAAIKNGAPWPEGLQTKSVVWALRSPP